ncbi:MAG TPA: hypothetical protein VFV86_03090 [Nitrososphaeraceae archaeon]|nr:hypothetical protein [Nitrososphaeraceae archaeon]
MKCTICERTRIENSEYCIYHNKARCYLKENYKKWNEAYSTTFTWNQYLVQLSQLKNVGIWIKEVIDRELKNVS